MNAMVRRGCRIWVGTLVCLCGVILVAGCSGQPATSSSVGVQVSVDAAEASRSVEVAASSASSVAAEDALYAQAEEALRAEFALEVELMGQGGAPELPAEWGQYVTGVFADSVDALYVYYLEHGWRIADSSQVSLAAMQRVPYLSLEGSVAALRYCIDATQTSVVNVDGDVVAGGEMVPRTVYFKWFDGQLKIFAGDDWVGAQCEN